jgi:type VI secretion system protein ImpG
MTDAAYSPNFLERYDEELRFLREEGQRFALAHPQIAGELGLSARGAADPYLERLLEGAAFLTARVHERLGLEQAAFAEQMLSRLAPHWDTPTPCMARVILEPDMASPMVRQATVLSRGARFWSRADSREDRLFTFVSGSDVRLWPIEVAMAKHVGTPPSWPRQGASMPGELISFFHMRIGMQQLSGELAAQLSILPLHFIGPPVAAHALFAALATAHVTTLAWPVGGKRIYRTDESPSIMGLGEESLLPVGLGELPGTRLLREYFAHPALFLGMGIPLPKDATVAAAGGDLEVVVGLSTSTSPATRTVTASDVATCVVPVANLYTQHCQPVTLDAARNEHALLVDRTRPRAHAIHHLANVTVIDAEGKTHACPAVHGAEQDRRYVHAMRRRDDDPAMVMLSIGSPAGLAAFEPPRVALVDALVCDRDLDPTRLTGDLSLDRALPVKSIRFAESPSASRAVPTKKQAWAALPLLAANPLRLRDSVACTEAARAWLSCLACSKDIKDARRIQSLSSLATFPGFKRRPGPGPLTWLRSTRLLIDVDERCHADGGAVLFGCVVRRALDAYLDINEASTLTLRLDGRVLLQERPT